MFTTWRIVRPSARRSLRLVCLVFFIRFSGRLDEAAKEGKEFRRSQVTMFTLNRYWTPVYGVSEISLKYGMSLPRIDRRDVYSSLQIYIKVPGVYTGTVYGSVSMSPLRVLNLYRSSPPWIQYRTKPRLCRLCLLSTLSLSLSPSLFVPVPFHLIYLEPIYTLRQRTHTLEVIHKWSMFFLPNLFSTVPPPPYNRRKNGRVNRRNCTQQSDPRSNSTKL